MSLSTPAEYGPVNRSWASMVTPFGSPLDWLVSYIPRLPIDSHMMSMKPVSIMLPFRGMPTSGLDLIVHRLENVEFPAEILAEIVLFKGHCSLTMVVAK